MIEDRPIGRHRPRNRYRQVAALVGATLLTAACGGPGALPSPRPLVVSSGARLTTNFERVQEIHGWAIPQLDSIDVDPSFLIATVASEQDNYPWETLVIQGDTARVQFRRSNPDVQSSYVLYAHFHLMERKGRIQRWLPEAVDAEAYKQEREIVRKLAESWLLGRTIFDAQPHGLMDDLLYANENGHLDAFLFTARPDAFPDARKAWLEENPEALAAYRDWFRSTLGREPPGLREGSGDR